MLSSKSATKEPNVSLRTLESIIQALTDCGVCTNDDDILAAVSADGGIVKAVFFDDDHPKGGYAISQELPPGTTIIISLGDIEVGKTEPGIVPIEVGK